MLHFDVYCMAHGEHYLADYSIRVSLPHVAPFSDLISHADGGIRARLRLCTHSIFLDLPSTNLVRIPFRSITSIEYQNTHGDHRQDQVGESPLVEVTCRDFTLVHWDRAYEMLQHYSVFTIELLHGSLGTMSDIVNSWVQLHQYHTQPTDPQLHQRKQQRRALESITARFKSPPDLTFLNLGREKPLYYSSNNNNNSSASNTPQLNTSGFMDARRVYSNQIEPGRVWITSACRVVFQPYFNFETKRQYHVAELVSQHRRTVIWRRRYLLNWTAIELVMMDYESGGIHRGRKSSKRLMLDFNSKQEAEWVFSQLSSRLHECYPALYTVKPESDPSYSDEMVEMQPRLRRYPPLPSLDVLTLNWTEGRLGNYDYLTILNALADRTRACLSQYPVFPWVLADYTSTELLLERPDTFRDLSQPIGALNPLRLKSALDRYNEMSPRLPLPDVRNDHSIDDHRYMFGTFYSTPAYVLHFLVRKRPRLMLSLQSGKFDTADRMFWSMEQTWRNVTSPSADLKELIPEFYEVLDDEADSGDIMPDDTVFKSDLMHLKHVSVSDHWSLAEFQLSDSNNHPSPTLSTGDFLLNSLSVDFGHRQTQDRVHHVHLPPWSHASPDLFVRRLRHALECAHVRRHLNEWIDLVFGYKQRGVEAVEARNVFHPMTWMGGRVLEESCRGDVDGGVDCRQREAVEIQVREFGQMPLQLFHGPHPISTVSSPGSHATKNEG